MSKRAPVFGLLDLGPYKVYRRGHQHFVSFKDCAVLRRVQLDNRRQAEEIVALPLPQVWVAIERLLLTAKLRGSVNYYEVKHG